MKPPASPMMARLDAALAASRHPVDAACVRAERAGLLARQGKLDEALVFHTKRNDIISALAASDPANAAWQRDLSVSLNKLGDLAVAQDDLGGALRHITEANTIAERLATSDPANAARQRDLWVSYVKLADLCEKSQQAAEAQEWWQRAYETLAAMKERGLHVSPQDLGILDWLRTKVGGE
jgi:tetratricopeptide (TPR) repeat protein